MTDEALHTLAARLDKIEAGPAWAPIGSANIGPDDIVFIRPLHQALTPNQAREYQQYLEAKLERQVVVIPFPAEVALTHVSKELASTLISRLHQLECEVKALKAAAARPQAGYRIIGG